MTSLRPALMMLPAACGAAPALVSEAPAASIERRSFSDEVFEIARREGKLRPGSRAASARELHHHGRRLLDEAASRIRRALRRTARDDERAAELCDLLASASSREHRRPPSPF